MFVKIVSYALQGCIYLIKTLYNTILLKFNMAVFLIT